MATSIKRRTFLRGLGTAMALPLLEAMGPMSAFASEKYSDGNAPLRMAFVYVPNGAHMPAWTPLKVGPGVPLSPTLKSLEPFRDQINVISGLAHHQARGLGDGPGDHARSSGTFLTGEHVVKTSGREIRAGISVDQLAAKHLGRTTRFPSIELGCQTGRAAGDCDSGYSCAYSNNISWRTPTTPAPKETNPRLVFDRLFGSGLQREVKRSRAQRDADRKSVLDFVADDARRLQRKLGKTDQHKLAEYLDSVRSVERQIDHSGEIDFEDGDMRRPRGIPEKYSQHARLMGDLLALAFQTDTTRVATLMLANEGSSIRYKELGLSEGHHKISHHQNNHEQQRKIAQINRFHIEQLAHFLKRLSVVQEGDRSLLENSMIVYGSGISDGNRHNHYDLPIVLAGGGGGAFATGRHIRSKRGTPLMNLFVSMLQTARVPVEQVGDSTGPLAELCTG